MADLHISDDLLERLTQVAQENNKSIETFLDALIEKHDAPNPHSTPPKSYFQSLLGQAADAVFRFAYQPPLDMTIPLEQQITQLYGGILVDCNLPAAHAYNSERVEDVLGQTLNELMGTSIEDPDEVFRTFIENGYTATDLETVESLPDGTKNYYLNNVYSLIENGNLIELWGTFRDITAQKQMQETIQHSEQTLRRVIDFLPIAVSIAKNNGEIEYFNVKFIESFGYTHEDVTDLETWYQHAYPDDAYRAEVLKIWQSQLAPALQAGRSNPPVEYNVTTKNGDVRITEIQSSAIGDRFVGTFIDVTNRRKMETELRESEARYRALFEGALNPIVIYDKSANFVMVNPVGIKNLGVPFADVVGRPLGDFVPDMHLETVTRISHVLDTEEPLFLEDKVTLPDGDLWFWSVIQPVYDSNNRPTSAQVISYDITERKHAELIKIQLQKEQELADLREKFISIISHELRTPLTIIQSSAELILRYDGQLEPIAKAKKMNNILDQTKHLDTMIEEISALSMAQRGFLQYHPANMDIFASCEQMLAELEDMAQPHHQLILCNDSTLKTLYADENLLQHALTNLLANAIKYSPKGGAVTITLADVNGAYIITVQDEGIGIPPTEIPNLFRPFQRASNVDAIRGTGLGLSIVKEIIELHQGTITCESTLGAGTTFTITLPML